MKSTKYSAQQVIAAAKLASDLFQKKTVDPDAQTLAEIGIIIGTKPCQTGRLVREKVAAGQLEQVYKISKGRYVPAYRIPKR